MSTLKVNTIQNTSAAHSSTPEEIAQGRAKAWVNYNQMDNNVRDSFNVSSVTDNSGWNFTINFSTNFSNTNYVPVGFTHRTNAAGRVLNHIDILVSQTTALYQATNSSTTNGQVVGLANYDAKYIFYAFFGD